MLNSGERPIQTQKRISVATERSLIGTYGNTSNYPIDVVTHDKFPKRAEHPALFEKVKPLQLINVIGRGKDDRMRRIMREVRPSFFDPFVILIYPSGSKSFEETRTVHGPLL